MQNVEDLRVRRTHKLLQKALIELTIEKGFADVTVHDIAERAMVNRSTFYRHYQDKYDLLSRYMAGLSQFIDSQEGEASLADGPYPSPDTTPAGLVRLLKHMQLNADFYRVMLGRKGDPAFCAEGFRPYIEQGIRRMLPNEESVADPSRPPIDLSVNYVLHAGVGAILWWLEDEQRCPPEQLAVWLYQLSIATIGVSLGPSRKVAGRQRDGSFQSRGHKDRSHRSLSRDSGP